MCIIILCVHANPRERKLVCIETSSTKTLSVLYSPKTFQRNNIILYNIHVHKYTCDFLNWWKSKVYVTCDTSVPL